MTGRKNGRVLECVAIDVNTQRDFFDCAGALPVVHQEELVPAIRRVIAWVKRNACPIVSSVEAHRVWELSDSGYPIHCVDGSYGQEKLDFTVFPGPAWIEADNTLALPVDLFSYHQQVIFTKRTDDLLSNPKADRLLTQLRVDEFVLFGAGIETSIKALALALLARAKRVTVIVDACGYWSQATADLALRQMAAKGACLSTVDELLARKLDRRFRYVPHRVLAKPDGNGHGNGRTPAGTHGDNGRIRPRLPFLSLRIRISKSNGHSRKAGHDQPPNG